MPLTMTRTRAQTALNKPAFSLAEVNGELAFLADLHLVRKDRKVATEPRRAELEQLRDALRLVIKRYDPDLEPNDVGESYEWLKSFGRKATAQSVRRYFEPQLARVSRTAEGGKSTAQRQNA